MPFIYSALLIIILFIDFYASNEVVFLIDNLCYTSPIIAVSYLLLSQLLKMCIWHRIACLIPVFPQSISLFDYYIAEIPITFAKLNIIVTGAMLLCLLFAAYKVFMK